MLQVDLVPNPVPWCTRKLVRQPAPAVARKIKLPAYRLAAGLEAALQTFFNQGTERGTLLSGYTPRLLYQLVAKLYGSSRKVVSCTRMWKSASLWRIGTSP